MSTRQRFQERTQARRATDVTRLTFPLQLVVLITTTSVTAAISIWGSQTGLRSDVRDIRTRMELRVEADNRQAQLEKERSDELNKAIANLRAEQRMQQLDIQALKETLLTIKTRGQ